MSEQYHIKHNLLIIKNKNNKWGAFNKELEIVLPFEYDHIYSKIKVGREILYSVNKDGNYGFVPAKNVNEFIKGDETEELASYLIKEKNNKYGITDIRGDFNILPIYDKIERLDISESYNYYDSGQEEKMLPDRLLLYKDGKVGLADYSKVLCFPEYDDIYAVTEIYKDRLKHVFCVKKNSLFGYMDAQGKVICDIKYEELNYPCNNVLTYAIYGNTIDIINIETAKVIFSVEKDITKYINFDYKHCCIANELDNCVYVLDVDGNVIAKFEIPEEIKDYSVCYINKKFLGYKKPIEKKFRYSFGLIDHKGKILSPPKYSNVIPIKGTYTVVTRSFFSEECELLDENCNVIMNNIVVFGGCDDDSDDGIKPPLMYEEFNNENSAMFYTDENLNPDKKNILCSGNNAKIVELFPKKEDDILLFGSEFEEEGKRYSYHVSKEENKIIVFNEDKSLYKSIDFEIAENDEPDFLEF